MQIGMQIGLKMEAGDCPTLNMNAKENYLLSHSLMPEPRYWLCIISVFISDVNQSLHAVCPLLDYTHLMTYSVNEKTRR